MFITALNNSGAAVWQAGATNSNTSALPTGLTNGTNAIAITAVANAKYNAITTTGTAAVIRTAINTNANWSGGASVQTYSGAFTVTGCGGVTCEAVATFTEPDCTICTNPPTVAPEGPYTTCIGDAVLLGDASFGGSATAAQWSITAAAGGAAIGNGTLSNTAMTATPAAVTFTGTVAGTYTLTLTSNNPLGAPCVATNATTIVTVIADQVGTLSYPKATYCANETDPTPTVTGGSADDEFTATTGLVIDAGTGVVDLSASTPGTYTITYRTSLSAACPGFATFVITINAAPTAGISITETSGIANDGTVCADSPITLTATGGTSYNWTLPDATTSTTNPQSIASAAAANAGTYTVTVTNASGCTATTTTAVVNVFPTCWYLYHRNIRVLLTTELFVLVVLLH
ncbi:MAG: hypothetical protein IPN94_09940 [Sphingobacteriales bacterium]|nr:hypothetical protein [Sphingobacteriales bacterium]